MIKRYSLRDLDRIFSDKHRYECWLKIEETHIDFLASNNIIDYSLACDLKSQFVLFTRKIKQEEKKVNHDVAAFVNYLISISDSPIKKWIHYGLTSSDVVDSANGLILQNANDFFVDLVKKLIGRIKRLSFKHKHTYIPRFLDGEIDGIDSLGLKFAFYYSELQEALEVFNSSRKYVECVSISGSTGINAHISPDINDFVATRLGLYTTDSSTQVISRDRYFKHFSAMNRIVQTVAKMATEFRFLNRTEINIVSESFFKGQIGSSSMPHKKNPILMENICGLARLFSGYASVPAKNIQLWFERDLTHSSVDRVVFFDAFTTASQVVRRMTNVLRDFFVNVDRSKQLIKEHSYQIYARTVRRVLMNHLNRSEKEIDNLMDEFKSKMQKNNCDFRQMFEKSNLVEWIGKDLVNSIFKPEYQLPLLDSLFGRIFFSEIKKSNFSTIYYDKDQILYAIDMMAQRLNYMYKNVTNPVKLIALREGSTVFLSHLLPQLKFDLDLTTVNTSRFKHDMMRGQKSSKLDIDFAQFKNRSVLIIDDFVDSAVTIYKFKQLIKFAADIKSATLFVKDDNDSKKYVDIYGLSIPSIENVAGFGMDLDGRFRNCPFVGVVKPEIAKGNNLS